MLQLKATTLEECDVISTLVQDSIFHFQLHMLDNKTNCFHMLINRFCWEDVENFDKEQCYFRVHSGLYVHNVKTVIVNENLRNNRHKYLSLLAVHVSQEEVNILFADNKHICIKINSILMYLQDLHDKYPTMVKPNHADAV